MSGQPRNVLGWWVAKPIAHGTYSGFRQHQRQHIPADGCGCRDAYNAYKRGKHYRKQRSRVPRPRPQIAREHAMALLDEALAGLNTAQLALRLGVTTRTITRWRKLLREQPAAATREEDDQDEETEPGAGRAAVHDAGDGAASGHGWRELAPL